jgi:hypothetical protein
VLCCRFDGTYLVSEYPKQGFYALFAFGVVRIVGTTNATVYATAVYALGYGHESLDRLIFSSLVNRLETRSLNPCPSHIG